MTKFHALRVPAISVKDYLNRIFKYASCSYECFVLALIYIDRVIQRNSFVVNSLNVHRVVITAVMLAAKFFDDQYYNNAYYAKIGGVPCPEMNSLELEFLFLVNFTLHVPPDVYEKYTRELSNHAQQLLDHEGGAGGVQQPIVGGDGAEGAKDGGAAAMDTDEGGPKVQEGFDQQQQQQQQQQFGGGGGGGGIGDEMRAAAAASAEHSIVSQPGGFGFGQGGVAVATST